MSFREDFATAWMNLGIVLSALKRYNESEESYSMALSHRTKYPDCLYNLGVLVSGTKINLKNLKCFRDTNEQLCLQYLEQRHYDKALKAWENATRQRRMHRRAWTNMILLLDDLGT